MELLIATTNLGKLAEVAAVLKALPIEIVPLSRIENAPAVVEDGKTFEENAVKKAHTLAEFSGLVTLADDSGLEVDAVGGAPGVHSARYSGDDADDARNNQKLLQALTGVPEDKRGARFVCVLALCAPAALKGGERLFRGECEGRIAFAPKGASGFGYDPLFFYPPLNRTFAELDCDAKGRVSHRGAALRKLAAALPSLLSWVTSGE
ncbi:MAG: non-canonical purine NTP pyrophosphatase, RdgB/HAM1 family [Deltaproteobacteria bacterium RIFCSPLOWO2_12_FULL_60_19]|nr:MAG: non-canonical purine NTP pyrophosphatase, RdgB/HAM1 family [Deltaproteobacteria bacterium RIFCSPLOWO2_12_FULL_60_19]